MPDVKYKDGNTKIVKNINVFVGTISEIQKKVQNKEVGYLDFLFSSDTYEFYIGSKTGKAVCVGTGRSINKEEITKLVKSVTAEELSRLKGFLEQVMYTSVDTKLQESLAELRADISSLNTNDQTIASSLQTLSHNDTLLNEKIGNITSTIVIADGKASVNFTPTLESHIVNKAYVDSKLAPVITLNAEDVHALPDSTKFASNIEFSVDTNNYVLSAQLKDQDGNDIGDPQTVDLPLESVVINGSYNSETKKVDLTLQGGSHVEFSIVDLVSGLANDNTVVHSTGDETVEGQKTFSTPIIASIKSSYSNNTLTFGTNDFNINFQNTIFTGRFKTNGNHSHGLLLPLTGGWETDKTLATEEDVAELLALKIDKVNGATAGHIATLDANGSVVDSSIASANVALISGNNTFSGENTFSSNITISEILNGSSATGLKIGFDGYGYYNFSSSRFTSTRGTPNLGESSHHWKEGFIDKITDTKGSYDSDNIINSIKASEMTNSTHFTQEQFATIRNGKYTHIIGTISHLYEVCLFGGVMSSEDVYRGNFVACNQYGQSYFGTFLINQDLTFQFQKTFFTSPNGRVNITNLYEVNSKQLPANPESSGTFVNKMIDGTWTWAGEWYGTQAEYDAIQTKNPTTTYNITEN